MQENQPIINNNVTEPTAPSVVAPQPAYDKPKTNNFLVILLSTLLLISCLASGFFAYQTQTLVKELTNLKSSPSPLVQVSMEPDIEPVASIDPTVNWKTYEGDLFSFKYPSNWIKNGDFILKGENPSIRVVIAEEGSLMNECMRQGQPDLRTGFVVKNFTRVNNGEMCSGGDSTELESWIVKDINSYGPGLQIYYNSNEPANQLPNAIISNIISTFKFKN
jgi:hypothetical protein